MTQTTTQKCGMNSPSDALPESGIGNHSRTLAGASRGKCDGAFQGRDETPRILNEFMNWSAWVAV